jgi:ABC-2 type transport system permease protein
MIFWTLVFPIVLGTFFNLAFSNLSKEEKLDVIDIAVVEKVDNKSLKDVLDTLSKEGEEKIFNTKYVTDEEAKLLLNENEIAGYIVVGEELNIYVKENSIEQTIIKYVIDEYLQMNNVAKNVVEYNPQSISNGALALINENKEYFSDESNKNMDSTVNYFYTLIGMACIYGSFFGVYTVNEVEANLSKKGARITVAPIKKTTVVLSSLLVSLLVHYAEVLILIGYLTLILGIDFGNQIGYILLLAFFGSLAGISMGILIGVSNKKSENTKMGILISVTMLCSFLAGMMMMQMKYIIAKNIPLLGYINPVNMITDGLYSLYCYNTLDRYYINILGLVIFSLSLCAISYVFLRRKKYDSI